MIGHRLDSDDVERLTEVFVEMDNAVLMEVVWLIENLIRDRRKSLTMRERYCSRNSERRIREIMSTLIFNLNTRHWRRLYDLLLFS